MIVFNTLAAVMVVPALCLGYAVQGVAGAPLPENGLAVLIGMAIALALDLGHRLRKGVLAPWPLVHPEAGGQLMLLPVWSLALLMIVKVMFDQVA